MLRLSEIQNEGRVLSELSTHGCVAREERQLTYRRKRGCKSRHIHFLARHALVELMPIELCLALRPAGPHKNYHILDPLLLFSPKDMQPAAAHKNNHRPAGDILPSRRQERFRSVPAIDGELSRSTLQRSVIRLTGDGFDE
jgi:hypothetical protein